VTTAARRAAAVAGRFHARWLTLLRDQPGNPCGVEVRWFADDLVATVAVDEPELRWVQHVAGFAERHLPLLDEILDWYATRRVPCRFETCDDAAVAVLRDRGAVVAGPIDLLVGRPSRGLASTVAVEEITTDRAEEFADLLLAGHEVAAPGPPHLAAVAGFVDSPRMRCWIAEVEGRPIGAAAFFEDDGVGYLANAATIPAGRGQGAQTALIAARLAAALDAGCDLVATLAIPGGSSHRNLVRAGLEPTEHRHMLHVG